MANCREIVSLQFGHYSNHIGAHWWNIQESSFVYNSDTPSEINHDVLFREGLTPSGYVTYTPRLLLVDLKGSLGHLPEKGELYEQPLANPEIVPWPREKVEVLTEPTTLKNEFLQDIDEENVMDQDDGPTSKTVVQDALKVYKLENVVKVWADYLRQRFHPRTVSIINKYEHANDSQPFNNYKLGANLWNTEQFEEDFTDRIRNLVEECDNMQGFHILLDGYDGFGGLGVGALQYLRDEYPSKSTLVFPTLPSTFPDSTAQQDSCRVLNLMFCLQNVSEHCSLFAPLCLGSKGWRQPGPPRTFPHLLYDASLAYHSSAILATALDTITLRYRCRESSASGLAELCDELSRHGRRAAATSLGLPFAMKPDGFLLDTLETWQGPLWQSLSPNCLLEEDRIWMQSVVLRGITPNRMRNPKKEEEYTLKSNQAYTCTSIKDMLSLFLSCCSYATLSHVTVANSACRVTAPFPQIYSDYVSIDGSISDTKRFENTSVYSVPAIAGLHTSSSVGTMLESLHFQSNRLQFKKFHHFSSAGLEEDEYTECLDQLLQLRECYYEEFDV